MTAEMGYVPVSAAMQELGVSKQRVHQLCLSGKLFSVKVNGTRLVSMLWIRNRQIQQDEGRRADDRVRRRLGRARGGA